MLRWESQNHPAPQTSATRKARQTHFARAGRKQQRTAPAREKPDFHWLLTQDLTVSKIALCLPPVQEEIRGSQTNDFRFRSTLHATSHLGAAWSIFFNSSFAPVAGSIPALPRLSTTGREAPALVDFIMSKDCLVSTSLTGNDDEKLLNIKQAAAQDSAPPLTSNEEK